MNRDLLWTVMNDMSSHSNEILDVFESPFENSLDNPALAGGLSQEHDERRLEVGRKSWVFVRRYIKSFICSSR